MTTLQLILTGAFLFACGFVWGRRVGYALGWVAAQALVDSLLKPVSDPYKFDEDTHS